MRFQILEYNFRWLVCHRASRYFCFPRVLSKLCQRFLILKSGHDNIFGQLFLRRCVCTVRDARETRRSENRTMRVKLRRKVVTFSIQRSVNAINFSLPIHVRCFSLYLINSFVKMLDKGPGGLRVSLFRQKYIRKLILVQVCFSACAFATYI